jgi:TonB family protein
MRFYPFLCLACSCVLAVVPDSLLAQDQSEASPDAAFLVQAAKSYGIPEPSSKSFHLRVSFQLLDANGNETDHGTYEEFSRNQIIGKRIYKTEHFSQTAYFVPGTLATGDLHMAPPFFFALRTAILTPIIGAVDLEQLIASHFYHVSSEYRTLGGASLHCYDIVRSPEDAPWNTFTYCFDDNNALVRYSLNFFLTGDASYKNLIIDASREHPGAAITVRPFTNGDASLKNPVPYEGRMLPGDVVIERRGMPTIKAHLESIETITDADESLYQAPDDAKPVIVGDYEGIRVEKPISIGGNILIPPPLPPPPPAHPVDSQPGQASAVPPPKRIYISAGVAMGMLLEHQIPIYPPEAKTARVSGTVVLESTIGKDGAVEELRVVSGPAMLQQAALDAVRTWRYSPYLLNGEPIEVRTTVNVIFTLPPLPTNQQPQ